MTLSEFALGILIVLTIGIGAFLVWAFGWFFKAVYGKEDGTQQKFPDGSQIVSEDD